MSLSSCGVLAVNDNTEYEKKIVCDSAVAEKPVIYIYDGKNEGTDYQYKEDAAKTVTLRLNGGKIGSTYPKIDSSANGWSFTAYKDGTLVDKEGKAYDYIFWDGEMTDVAGIDVSKGFSVKGSETVEFLENKLPELGLNQHEINDFITYWLPRMEKNPWNTFCFQTKTYTDWADLKVSPEPDTVIRVFVAWYPTEEEEKIEPQKFASPQRGEYTVAEWGGVEVRVEYVKRTSKTSTTTTTTTTDASSEPNSGN